MFRYLPCVLIFFLFSPLFATGADRPNVIVILTDDLGYSDLGCYGGEIETPTLDRLASNGLRFTQFYNTAKCHSSRVSLLSGRWCKQAGDISLKRAVTIPEVLAPNGYFTAMTGKWHLDREPTDFGFERYWGHLSGACNFFLGDRTFRLNGKPWEVPESDFYTTVANVDYALNFLTEARKGKKPYFLYIAFNAPHAPLQPLQEDYGKYEGRYDAGWDIIRKARLEKQTELGLFGDPVEAGPRPASIPAWDDLAPEMQDWESRRMTALAGMIDRVDQEIGRLVGDLEANRELENTFLLFLSDNGACPYDRSSTGIDQPPYLPTTSWSDSTGWAWVRNSPFRYYKQNQFEGGVATPAIVHWPAGIEENPGAVIHSPSHLVDVLPTVAEITGSDIPDTFPGRDPAPLAGTSLAPVLKGEEMEERPPIHFLFASDRGLREGKWKLVSFRSGPWELYDLEEDRTERHNLAAEQPGRVKEMAALWTRIAREQLRDPATPVSTESKPHLHPEWTVFSSPEASTLRHRSGRKKRSAPKPGWIRARKETSLRREDGSLIIDCKGTDSGLAMDRLSADRKGTPPFQLSFEMKSSAGGDWGVFVTTDPARKLPSGTRVVFTPEHTGQWETFTLDLPIQKQPVALRFDPGSTPGEVRVRGLTLRDGKGQTLSSWP